MARIKREPKKPTIKKGIKKRVYEIDTCLDFDNISLDAFLEPFLQIKDDNPECYRFTLMDEGYYDSFSLVVYGIYDETVEDYEKRVEEWKEKHKMWVEWQNDPENARRLEEANKKKEKEKKIKAKITELRKELNNL